MSNHARFRGLAAVACAAALVGGPAAVAVAQPGPAPLQAADCTAITILSFNDLHGRIDPEEIVPFAGTIEEERAAAGEENTVVVSAGDNIGGSPFISSSQQDNPTLDILNELEIDAAAAGNHEFDKGWDDLNGRVSERANFSYLAANVQLTDGSQPANLPAYEIVEKQGIRVAFVGAVTSDLTSLVSPAGIADLQISDPVESVNRVAGELQDGDDSNGEADVIVAVYHEGGPNSGSVSENLDNSTFASMVNDTDESVSLIINGHTHQTYAEAYNGRPVIQSTQYAENIGKTVLSVDATGAECAAPTVENLDPSETPADSLIGAYPRVAAISTLAEDAAATSDEIGQEVIGDASAPVSRGVKADGSMDDRGAESTMTNLIANMFREVLSERTGKDVIGVQNPGGTRDDFDAGEITYGEAAAVLPFANTLMTTDITGEQFKTMLEQQWQPEGASRPFLKLGLSNNVSYTYDESLPAGERITSVTIDGQPLDPNTTYTIGSGSFLISGGDNFTVLADGQNSADTGLVDLEAWVQWIADYDGAVEPDYRKYAVNVSPLPTELTAGETVTFSVSDLNISGLEITEAQTLQVRIDDDDVATVDVTDGAAEVTFTVPAGLSGAQVLTLVSPETQTEVTLPVQVLAGDAGGDDDSGDDGDKPGLPDTGSSTGGVAAALILTVLVGAAAARRR
ncbi:bifunctional metallophosphatase/5'-nucleotidase [Parenemella sanctibonifatiensis]|uniref:Bifunctional metallophosphatase/5'-nucleotidase n=1 Tax=Parenemella sanctibonifatiensis TaxID=2016505 RepID=A0A255DXU2_9ACTN|nr:bifunctional UDP-sugar hydrolase/5'-nucleotidase [Parenemella sanctibonifatiensis]OYN84118.1 bifunctional metallophosphatase/5'-nucleotidase [Parenemella sanctibonifatiensis]